MKKLVHIIAQVFSIFLLGCCVACTSDDVPLNKEGKTATLSFKIPQLETSARVAGTSEENAIKTLRIIILSQGAESINKKVTDFTSGPILIENVPVGPAQIYVIANEGALGCNYDDLNELQKDLVEVPGYTGKKALIEDLTRKYFPKRAVEANGERPIEKEGLPMSWMDVNAYIDVPVAGKSQEIKVDLIRSVAKLNIVMSNTLNDPIVITKMTFGKFFADRLFLFPEGELNVPSTSQYSEMSYAEMSLEIGANSSKSLVCYIYPSQAYQGSGASPYNIGFTTKAGVEYPPLAFTEDVAIVRNTQFNIYATLSSKSKIELNFEVKPWTTANIDVPPFN